MWNEYECDTRITLSETHLIYYANHPILFSFHKNERGTLQKVYGVVGLYFKTSG